MTELKHLFQPAKLGRMDVQNRIMMSGMSAGMMLDNDAQVTPPMIAYYVERAQARPGLMAVGASQVVPPNAPLRQPLGLYHDRFIPSLKKLVDGVHQYDTKFGIQLWDGGTQAGGQLHLSPSGIPALAQPVFDQQMRPVLKTLSVDEVAEVVQNYADGARRCMEAGFDFVEIHGGHGYIISAFLAPYFNRREDRYGGSFENRVRFLVEILRAVKAAVGDRLAVGVKLNGDDFLPEGGWTLPDTCRVAPMLEAEGADYLSITGGVMGAARLTVPPLYEPQGCFADMAAAVKKCVSIPVASVGRIKNPVMADDLIREGKIDIACMGRAMIADSQIVDKARRGELADIRLCLADCRGCIDQEMRGIKNGAPGSVSCVVNPRMQRESECIDIEGDKAGNPRKVLVVGAGLAGLEAARRAAFSGHQVTLCESRSWIGGQIRFAAQIPGRKEIADMLPWYERQLAKYRVAIRLDTTVDEALIAALNPDVVVVASGSAPQVPQDMLDLVYNAGDIEIVMADDLFEQQAPTGDNILVVGGDQIGMQIADYLSEGGAKVAVAETHGHFAQKLAANDRWYLIGRTIKKHVARFKNVRRIELDSDGQVVLVTDKESKPLPGIDTIVFANERRSVRSVAEIAKAKGIETFVIGDAADVVTEDSGTILMNIAQAYDVGRRI